MALNFVRPLHPGEYLREEFLIPLNLSPGMLARSIGVPRTRIERVVKEEIGITPDSALRLARYFGTTPEFWMNFQQAYELETQAKSLASDLAKIKPLDRAA